ncbi:MAG: glycerate kinase [Pseudomonadota bacterium]
MGDRSVSGPKEYSGDHDVVAARALLLEAFEVATQTVSPARLLPAYLPPLRNVGTTYLLAVGKAAASMARAALDYYGQPLPGLVLTRYGHGLESLRNVDGLEVVEAGHPVPDAEGLNAARRVLELAESLGPEDQLLALLSGGGSALLAAPAPGITLEDKQQVTRALLASGASIREINCVRKHLSSIKGGRLALAANPASVTTLIISDVVGDDPAMVASGPTVADLTTLAHARRILELYNIEAPACVQKALYDEANETPTSEWEVFQRGRTEVVGRARQALSAVGQFLSANGYQPIHLGDDIEGEAREVGMIQAALALHYQKKGQRFALISGGECTVHVNERGGSGGPNTEYLLALVQALGGAEGITAIACDTDGIDGTEDNAGALIDQTTLARARDAQIDLQAALRMNQSYEAFAELGDLVMTGPTRTNVNDLRIVLVHPEI